MSDREQLPAIDEDGRPAAPVVRTKGLLAEYSVGKRPSGDWFAVGTVRGEHRRFPPPAWLIVGSGKSQEDAVADLTSRLEREAERLEVA